jgi:hypothetical protein
MPRRRGESILFEVARFTNIEQTRNDLVRRLGFRSAGEVDLFLRQSYGKAVAEVSPADRLRGHMFVLRPVPAPGLPVAPERMIQVIQDIKRQDEVILAIPTDLSAKAEVLCKPTITELSGRPGGSWSDEAAQALSESLDKCVVIGNGVAAKVFVSGRIYLELSDVIEGLVQGPQTTFQNLSWNDGLILCEFAKLDLGDRSSSGIWRLPDKFVLKHKPEADMRRRLRDFLGQRLAGWSHLIEEAHVENEGRLDVAVYLVNHRCYLVEIKWMGRAVKGTHKGKSDARIAAAADKTREKSWFTEFHESTIDRGVGQVLDYCSTGKYHRGYLAVFDCRPPGKALTNPDVTVRPSCLKGRDPGVIRIIQSAVDPRSASKR